MGVESQACAAESYLVRVEVGGAALDGHLALPAEPRGIVLFAHPSGSSRHSPRNKLVARALREDVGAGTLLVDLLSPAEGAEDARTGKLRFDIERLASRLLAICDWIARGTRTTGLPIGLFGASTGAAAALVAAAACEDVVAVVSRGGRPDLAGEAVLARVRAPTLFIVGGDDAQVLVLNRRAAEAMAAIHELTIIPGAGHLFSEPGAIEQMERHAARWFDRYFPERSDTDEPRG